MIHKNTATAANDVMKFNYIVYARALIVAIPRLGRH